MEMEKKMAMEMAMERLRARKRVRQLNESFWFYTHCIIIIYIFEIIFYIKVCRVLVSAYYPLFFNLDFLL